MQRKIVLASLLLKHFIAESRVRSPQVLRSHSCRARPKAAAAELGEPVRMRPTVEADGREAGAEGPLAVSVGLRTRRWCPPAGPAVLPSAGITVGKTRGRRGRADVQVDSSRILSCTG